MFKALKALLIAGIALTGLPSNGLAADYDNPIFVEQAPELQPVEVGNGWYIRGDIGVNFAGKHDTSEYAPAGSTGVRSTNEFGDVLNAGLGIGYQFNDYLRFDAGIERVFASSYSATTLVAPRGPCLGWGVIQDPVLGEVIQDPYNIDNCLDVDSASYNATNLMANAYVDLGTYLGFTPYIGGGLGIARVAWREETDATICIPTDAAAHEEGCNAIGTVNQPAPNTPYTEQGITNNGADYRFAYAVAAGVGYKMSNNLTLDMSYRMLNVGANDVTYSTTPGSGMASDGFGTQQLRVGFRYSLW